MATLGNYNPEELKEVTEGKTKYSNLSNLTDSSQNI